MRTHAHRDVDVNMLLFKNCLLALVKAAEGNKGTRTFLFFFNLEYSWLAAVSVFAVHQSESATCIHVSALPCISFMLRSPRSIEQVPCTTQQVLMSHPILCAAVCTHQSQPPDPSLSPSSLLGSMLFSTSVSLFLLCK